jgi:putative sigma-54 modulation protein
MVVSYSAKHVEIGDDMKEYLEKKLKRLKPYYDQILNVNVILELERGKYRAELKVSASHDTYFAKETADTWQASFDGVADKVETEVKKKKERISDHHK